MSVKTIQLTILQNTHDNGQVFYEFEFRGKNILLNVKVIQFLEKIVEDLKHGQTMMLNTKTGEVQNGG